MIHSLWQFVLTRLDCILFSEHWSPRQDGCMYVRIACSFHDLMCILATSSHALVKLGTHTIPTSSRHTSSPIWTVCVFCFMEGLCWMPLAWNCSASRGKGLSWDVCSWAVAWIIGDWLWLSGCGQSAYAKVVALVNKDWLGQITSEYDLSPVPQCYRL